MNSFGGCLQRSRPQWGFESTMNVHCMSSEQLNSLLPKSAKHVDVSSLDRLSCKTIRLLSSGSRSQGSNPQTWLFFMLLLNYWTYLHQSWYAHLSLPENWLVKSLECYQQGQCHRVSTLTECLSMTSFLVGWMFCDQSWYAVTLVDGMLSKRVCLLSSRSRAQGLILQNMTVPYLLNCWTLLSQTWYAGVALQAEWHVENLVCCQLSQCQGQYNTIQYNTIQLY